jgi:4-hydroxy-2-oxoheptanedioate aldolase
MAGAWCNMGSTLSVEMAVLAGFDWLLIDLEHGSADLETLILQLQTAAGSKSAVLARIAWNEPWMFKRVLDMGASGVMVPYVNTPEEAERAARSMRYPPVGIRGVAYLNRATSFGQAFQRYFEDANDHLTTVVQIETAEAVQSAEEIAAVEGVDVLFVGPLDLSVNLGIARQFDHPSFRTALKRVAAAASKHGKAAGILLAREEQLEQSINDGFRFIALGSDAGMVAAGMTKNAAAFARYREQQQS